MFDYFRDGFWHGLLHLVHDFQSLIAGLMALAAAGITAFYLRKQIQQVEAHRKKEKQRLQSFGVQVCIRELLGIYNHLGSIYAGYSQNLPEEMDLSRFSSELL